MSLPTQIIDQQVSGVVARQMDAFTNELRLGADAGKRRSVAFLFLVAKTMFDLSDDETLEGIVDGGDDYGVDALYFETPDQGEIEITLASMPTRGARMTGFLQRPGRICVSWCRIAPGCHFIDEYMNAIPSCHMDNYRPA